MSSPRYRRDPIKDVFNSFVQTQAQNKAVARSSFAGSHPIETAWKDWSIPHIDFGHVDDVTDKSLWREEWQPLWPIVLELNARGDLHLPFPECAYIFRYHEQAGMPRSVNIIHLIETDHEIIGECWFRQPESTVSRTWNLDAWRFVVTKGNSETIDVQISDDFEGTQEEANSIWEDAKASYSKSLVATVFLSTLCTTTDAMEHEPSRRAVNAGLVKRDMTPLPPMVRIRRDRTRTIASVSLEINPTGNTKTPHLRRGHYRRLRSGKVVPVRAARIHGGPEKLDRAYKVD